MTNFKLTIEYKGTNYAGWQRQKNQKTIQGEIEKGLKRIFEKKVDLIGSGRTDAGVHALGQVANFSVKTKLSKDKIMKALNFHLPEDVRIKRVGYTTSRFHSRFSARGKIYRYIVIQEYSPFLKDEAYLYPRKLNLNCMNEAARCFLGRHNFSSFQNQGSNRKKAIITLRKIKIRKTYLKPGRCLAYIFEVEANAFLYRMARNIVGLLLEVGKGKILPGKVKSILKKQDRCQAPPPVPAYGLYLWKVKY